MNSNMLEIDMSTEELEELINKKKDVLRNIYREYGYEDNKSFLRDIKMAIRSEKKVKTEGEDNSDNSRGNSGRRIGPNDRLAIETALKLNHTPAEIAKVVNVSIPTIYKIKNEMNAA